MSKRQQPLILWAEDSVEDTMLLNWAFERAGSPATLSAHGTAEEVISILEAALRQPSAVDPPEFLLTDLKLPGLSGFDLIAWIRAQEQFKSLNVGVLSGSPLKSDINRARALGADLYLTKPTSVRSYAGIVNSIMDRIQNGPSPGDATQKIL